MNKGKFERMVDKFETYYPDLAAQTVDWWPSGRMHVTVKLDDGMIFEFNSATNTIRRIRTEEYEQDSDALKKEIGRNLQKIIASRPMTQNEIASKVGITEAMLSRYMHGTSLPGVDKVYSLASVLGCRVIDILGEPYDEYNT